MGDMKDCKVLPDTVFLQAARLQPLSPALKLGLQLSRMFGHCLTRRKANTSFGSARQSACTCTNVTAAC